MDENELRERFPDLDTTKRSPSLVRINSIGFGLYGRSGEDAATRSYVAAQFFCVLWIPILPIARYRVVDAPGSGWFILGRLPLSAFEKTVRRVAIAAAVVPLAVGGWFLIDETTGFASWRQSRAQRARAEDEAEAGRIGEAAVLYSSLTGQSPSMRADARASIAALVGRLDATTDLATAESVLQAAAAPADTLGPVSSDLWQRACAYLAARTVEPAETQVAWIEKFAELAPAPAAVADARREIVERGAARTPADFWAVCELATLVAAGNDLVRAEALLAPFEARLGNHEAARVLGQIRFAQGRVEESFRLLEPYVTARLANFRKVSASYEQMLTTAQQNAIEKLDERGAPASWYSAYEAADEAKQGEMVRDWVVAELKADTTLEQERVRFTEAAKVVPVALDLGIVRVIRARSTEDAAEAQKELEAAESIFNAIGGVAADDPEFRFAAARVAYWLGKRDEYDAHLAAGIEAAGGGCDAMLAGAQLVASLGEKEAAEKRYRAAYKAAKTDQERYSAAHGVGIHTDDAAESIRWFERSDPKDASVAAALAERRARLAIDAGDRELAKRHLKEALSHYDKLPRSATTLNNAAIAAQFLSAVSGDAAILEDAAARMRAAIAELPTNVVLISNAASTLHTLAWVRGAGNDVDLTIGAQSWLQSRFDDEKTQVELCRAILECEDMKEAIRLSDRGLSLAPTNVGLLDLRAAIADDCQDVARLRQLLALAKSPDIDRAGMRQEYLDGLARGAARASLDAHRTHLAARIAAIPAAAPESVRASLDALDVQSALALWALGAPTDLEALDSRARSLRSRAATSATFTAERSVAAARLHDALCARSPRFKAASARTLRAVGVELLIVEALHRDGTLLAAVRTTPEFVRVADFAEAALRRFPTTAGSATRAWLLLAGRRAIGSDGTAADEPALWMLSSRVGSALRPFDAATALSAAWTYRLVGDPVAEEAVLAACAKDGGLLPYRE